MKDSGFFGLTEKELSDLISVGGKLLIYDLRKKEDFAKGHIKKSIPIQFNEDNIIDASKSSKVVLVSKDEEQSKKMALSLRNQNIEAFYLIGGINNWTSGLYCTNISYVGTGYP